MSRVTITIPDRLLVQIDTLAQDDYTTRSDIIRQAMLFYMRSVGSSLSPDEFRQLLADMRRRKLKAHLNKVTNNRYNH